MNVHPAQLPLLQMLGNPFVDPAEILPPVPPWPAEVAEGDEIAPVVEIEGEALDCRPQKRQLLRVGN